MKISWACIIWLAIATNSINTKRAGDSPARTRTLILIDNASLYATHSQFFELFKTQGHALTIEQISVRIVTENLVKIEEDKEFLYDNIIFLASSMPELPDTTNFSLTRFFEKGNNIFFVVDNDVSPFFRSYFRKFGFGIDEAGSYLVDYTKAPNPTIPNLFQVDNFKDIDLISDGVEGPLLYNGVGLETSIFENTQITVFARGGLHTASVVYGVNGEKSISRLGKQNLLLLGIQGIQRGRIVVTGSLEMLSNSLFTASKNSNRRLAGNLISWLSNERGIIRRGPLDYSCTDASGKDSECPKGCYFRFSMDLEYWNWKRREWEPYSDPSVALEITMMTPKYRSNLPETKERKGHYKVRGPMPYRMGTYRFKVNHNRPGWNRVSVYRKIEMRNNHYLEYTKKWGRDLTSAVGVVCILASFALVSFIFVYDDERAKLLN